MFGVDYRNWDFTLRQLQYVVAVADLGTFGRAADACGVSQPSLSAQVAKLEQVLDTQVFERHARATQLTAAGRSLMPHFRQALAAAQAVDDAARRLADPYGATLRIGVIPTVAPYVLPQVVERLRHQARAPRLHWLELQTRDCEARLAEGELDAMLIADPPQLASVEDVELGWEPFCVVVPHDHQATGTIALDDFAEQTVLLLEDGHCLRTHTIALCHLPGAMESPYRATSLPTLVQMVAAGLGASVLPASAVPLETSRARVRTLDFAAKGVGRTLRLAWRTRTPYRDVLVDLATVMQASFAQAVAAGMDNLTAHST